MEWRISKMNSSTDKSFSAITLEVFRFFSANSCSFLFLKISLQGILSLYLAWMDLLDETKEPALFRLSSSSSLAEFGLILCAGLPWLKFGELLPSLMENLLTSLEQAVTWEDDLILSKSFGDSRSELSFLPWESFVCYPEDNVLECVTLRVFLASSIVLKFIGS